MERTPSIGGVLLQFPFYAMILGMMAGTGLNEKKSSAPGL
jgi:short subunit fatty acids transporter